MTTVELNAREILLIMRGLENRREWIEKEGKKAQWRPSEIALATAECNILAEKLMDLQE